jgi:hypothetical protein
VLAQAAQDAIAQARELQRKMEQQERRQTQRDSDVKPVGNMLLLPACQR